ncbi:FAD:protein FMN transferase [Ructibacterium gallinarum]|uniref:FAD:protein FMN transferase n=1 Tax=Ructibacterium gallinarum TaxID=2779355 RepID=A0A9D5LWK1_9FIRM|nr:FAD:protein FMN transferase [Ructibacterium gallinarum]MBE5039033.1 FAD:protein FMN transferase [Ructibacterium gallinarum]
MKIRKIAMGLLSVFFCLLLPGCGQQEYCETQFLLDTVCTIRAGGPQAEQAVKAAFERIREIQEAVNFYSDTSVVAAFNRAAEGERVQLDADTTAVLKAAQEISRLSGGAFDVTIAPVSRLWPFHGEETAVPPEDKAILAALSHVGWEKVVLDAENQMAYKTEDGVMIDLGGAAKGYAADCAAAAMQECGAAYGVLDLGGNVLVFGKNPGRKSGQWQVGVQKPFGQNGEYSRTLTIDSGAVVTSGIYQRNFWYDGKLYHHILDPATGYPVDTGLSAVTIAADSALLADCLSTAAMVLGEENGKKLAESCGAEIYFERE